MSYLLFIYVKIYQGKKAYGNGKKKGKKDKKGGHILHEI